MAIGLAVFAEISRREAQAQRVAAEAAKKEAQGQRDRAERALGKANHTAETLIFGLADKFRETTGMPRSLVRGILEPA